MTEQEELRALEPYLPGLKEDMPETFRKLAELMKFQAFELCTYRDAGKEDITCIPYMMNDALECYLILENCRITGRYLPDYRGETEAYLTRYQDSHGLVVKQGEENVFTLWFQDISEKLQCYQYHEIGHFWVKGQEQWRQLVYMIGTIYDKYEYLGENVCTEKERELLPLMEFAPFRVWSPVKESLDDWYIDTLNGVDCMKALALKAGEKNFAKLLEQYKKHPILRLEKKIIKFLRGKRGVGIYEILYRKVREASEEYPERDYGKVMNEKIQNQRKEVAEILKKKGFEGQYPCFRREHMQILAAEEHPFTILEAEDFVFRIQFMVSVSRGEIGRRNSGFFKGWGNSGRIEQDLEFLNQG